MPAYWMTFKPKGPSAPKGWPIERLQDLVSRFETDPTTATEWWRITSHQAAQVGNRVYLFKQGDNPRGIFGVGKIIDGPEMRDSPDDTDGLQHRALLQFDQLVDPTKGFLLTLDEILDIVPDTRIRAQASGTSITDEVADQLDERLPQSAGSTKVLIKPDQSDDDGFDPESVKDTRHRALRAIRMRRGQAAFRAALFAAYGGRCTITGCAVPDVLEAAHITPYLGSLTNHITNGLLLRADLHTLFDCSLLGIDPNTRRVVTAASLAKSSYGKLSGTQLRQPTDSASGPSKKALQRRFSDFDPKGGVNK